MNSRTAVRRFTYGALGFSALFFATVLGSMPSVVHSGHYIPKALFVFASGALLLVAVAGCAFSLIGLAVSVVIQALKARAHDPSSPPSDKSEESGA